MVQQRKDDREPRRFWVVVADAASAVTYSQTERRGELTREYEIENPYARTKSGELLSDRGGRSFDSYGSGRHTLAKEVSPKDSELARFANEVTRRLVHAQHGEHVVDTTFVAAPRLLGLLRKAAEPAGLHTELRSINKDASGREPAELLELLNEHRQ
ncbi:MAG: host attachment protein [Woeseiaceae bacterium]|nr:host attachment protein [Woeseiaceae bacterium]